MAGKIRQTIDKIIAERSKGNETIQNITRAKLLIKGIKIDNYNSQSEDNPEIIARLHEIANEMGVKL